MAWQVRVNPQADHTIRDYEVRDEERKSMGIFNYRGCQAPVERGSPLFPLALCPCQVSHLRLSRSRGFVCGADALLFTGSRACRALPPARALQRVPCWGVRL